MAKDLISSFIPTAEVFPQRPLTLQIGAEFGPFYINFFATRPTLIGRYTANPTIDQLTVTSHGLTNGQMVQVTSGSAQLTDGLETGELYFAAHCTTDTLCLSVIPGGTSSSLEPLVDIKSSDPGNLYKCGTPYDLTNHRVWAWVKHLKTDSDNDLILDLQPSITGASFGFGYDWRVTFTKSKTQTFSLDPAVHVWSLLLQFPDGTRSLLIDNSRFTIALPTTHPALAS